jgi:hypothetical protein
MSVIFEAGSDNEIEIPSLEFAARGSANPLERRNLRELAYGEPWGDGLTIAVCPDLAPKSQPGNGTT